MRRSLFTLPQRLTCESSRFLFYLLLIIMSIMVLNFQGACSLKFLRTLKMMINHNKVSVLTLLEPQISGTNSDKIIKKVSFAHLFCVEALGFTGGTWIL